MALVDIGGAVEAGGIGIGEEALDLGAQGRLVGLDREQIVRARVLDRSGDRRVGGDGVDRDEGPFEPSTCRSSSQIHRCMYSEICALGRDTNRNLFF
jgi:hypothetical protein